MELRSWLLLAALVGVACTSGERPGHGSPTTITERVGDTLVVRTVGVPDSVTLRLVEELRIGELEGAEEYTFGNVLSIAPAHDGGAYVWDSRMRLLRQYDATGRYVRQVGRRGEGPGEYESVGGMATMDGRLVFWDRYNHHVAVYDGAGALLQWWKPMTMSGITGGMLHPGTADRIHLELPIGPFGADGIPPWGYVSYDLQGGVGDTVPQVDCTENQRAALSAEGPRGGRVLLPPYVPLCLSRFSPLGYAVHGRTDRYALTFLRGGEPPRRIERVVEPVPISEAERDEEQAHIVEVMRRRVPGWEWPGEPLPTRKPYWQRLLFGADGRAWVERAGASTRIPDDELPPEPDYDALPGLPSPYRWRQPIRYDLFEPDGRFLGTAERPDGAELLHMRGDTVWGVVRDSLDVPYVVRWRLEPSIVR